MLKLLLIGLNFLNLFNYQVIVEEEVKYEEILYQDEFYVIYKEADLIKLKTVNDEWIRELNITSNIKAFLVDRDLYIFDYYNSEFKCIVYGIEGNLKKEKIIFNNQLLNYNIEFYNDNFYIVGSLSQYTDKIFTDVLRDDLDLKDGFILELDSDLEVVFCRTYGGVLNEEFFKITFTEDYIYIVGKKDILASGDFGNGGKSNGDIFITKLDSDKNILDTLVINDTSKIVDLFYFKDNIFLGSVDYLYKLSPDLLTTITNKIPETGLFITPASYNKIVVIGGNYNYIYDFLNLRLIETVLNEKQIITIKEFNNILYIKSDKFYYFDIASLEDLAFIDEIYSEFSPVMEVKTIYGDATYIEDVGEIRYDATVYGTYLRKFKFTNSYGASFIVEKKSVVRKEANVSEGGIYPLGYNLLFTGIGYLNGNSIANNYSIASAGDYTLKLVGLNNEEYDINFKVDGEQISFEETKVIDYHGVVKKGDVYYINLNYTNDIGEIASVTVDGEDYTNILVNKTDKTISVKMEPKSVEGIYYHVINSINYKENDLIRKLKVNEVYVVNVLKDVMTIDVNKMSDYEYKVNLTDANTARYFLVSYIHNNQEYSYKYSLSSNKVYIEALPEKENLKVSLSIYYDLGDKSYKRCDLMNLVFNNLDDNNILEIDVLKKEEALQEFVVKVANEEDLIILEIDNVVIFQKVEKDYYLHIIIGIVMLITIGFGIYKIRYNNYKKKIGL